MEREASIEKKNRGKRRSNRELYTVMYFFVFLFMALMGYFAYYVQFRSEESINSAYNMRQQNLAKLVLRGNIYSADGEILAEQALDSSGKEVRFYPQHKLFAHAAGYATHGGCGVEKEANIMLLTSNAPFTERVKNEMSGERNIGDNIYTTFDTRLQKVASEALGVYKGAIVVMEVKTGRILALVSKPDFDPNDIDSDWEKISSDTNDSPLLNRAFQGLYPPGSTFKTVTLLEYLREHPDDYKDYSYNCRGRFTKDDATIECFHGTAHGKEDLFKSYEKSCNSSFANIGSLIDVRRFYATAGNLLFNQELPLRLPYKKSRFTLSEESDLESRLQSAIGQGDILITPIHMTMITAAIANDGLLMMPYEIDRRTDYKGNIITDYMPNSYGHIMTAGEAAVLKEFMTGVVENGTGRRLKGLSYTAAGKTGSAEYGNVKGESHAWFTGFSNVEDPDIAVTVIMEGAGSGGDYAVPMAKRIFDAYYDNAGINSP